MPQPPQQQSNIAFFDNADGTKELSVFLLGYVRHQVDVSVQRLGAALMQAERDRDQAEQRLTDSQRKLRHAEQKSTSLEQRLSDTSKQLEENSKPTLSGLGTRVEQ